MSSEYTDTSRIEVKTLVSTFDRECNRADAELAAALNECWEIQHIAVNTAPVQVGAGTRFVSTRVVTLIRLVEAGEAGADRQPDADRLRRQLADDVQRVAVRTTGPDFMALMSDEPPVDEGDTRELPMVEPTPALAEALLSGKYTTEELRVIAEREAWHAGLTPPVEYQHSLRLLGGQRVDTLVCRLPQPALLFR